MQYENVDYENMHDENMRICMSMKLMTQANKYMQTITKNTPVHSQG